MSAIAAQSNFRTTQRLPLACQECSRRKVKCDKLLPCARCRRLNLPCQREYVKIKHNLIQHADEIQFLDSVTADLESISHVETLQPIIQKLKQRSRRLQFGDHAPQPENDESFRAGAAVPPDSPSRQQQGWSAPGEAADPSIPTALEHLAWGRMSGKCFPHRSCACRYSRDRELLPSVGSPSLDAFKYIEETGVKLPSPIDARKLVQFHIHYLVWHHNCLHAPTFQEECETFWQTGRCAHPQWLALYTIVLSITVFAIENSVKSQRIVEIDPELLPSAQDLFLGFVNMLHRSRFLQDINLYTAQAIALSNEVANNLGQSQLNSILFSAAVRVAEYLGMHRIENYRDVSSQGAECWQERVEREVGKRIWSQMMVQDHFAIHFTDSYTISPAHVSTSIPSNVDDHDLVDMPRHVPTVSSYTRVLREMAALMPEFLDGLDLKNKNKSPSDQYQHVLNMDHRMRTTVKQFPSCFLRQDIGNEARLPWLRIARRSLAITAAEKIIMIHRPFLLRSFHISQYDFTRRTCTAAARTILREHDALAQTDDLCIWTHTPFCITAAVILCFEISNSASREDSTTASLVAAITTTRDRLAFRKTDVLAQRGVALLNVLLDQPANQDVSALSNEIMTVIDQIPAIPFKINEVEARSLWYDMYAGDFSAQDQLGEGVGERLNEPSQAPSQATVEFDIWFNSMFANFE